MNNGTSATTKIPLQILLPNNSFPGKFVVPSFRDGVVASSGVDVPAATMVAPMTNSSMPRASEIPLAPAAWASGNDEQNQPCGAQQDDQAPAMLTKILGRSICCLRASITVATSHARNRPSITKPSKPARSRHRETGHRSVSEPAMPKGKSLFTLSPRALANSRDGQHYSRWRDVHDVAAERVTKRDSRISRQGRTHRDGQLRARRGECGNRRADNSRRDPAPSEQDRPHHAQRTHLRRRRAAPSIKTRKSLTSIEFATQKVARQDA